MEWSTSTCTSVLAETCGMDLVDVYKASEKKIKPLVCVGGAGGAVREAGGASNVTCTGCSVGPAM